MSSQLLQGITEGIGSTPLVRLNRLSPSEGGTIYGKAEFYNPGGSVKDRICLNMIDEAEKQSLLKPGSTIVEPTSGNTGIGMAMAAFGGLWLLHVPFPLVIALAAGLGWLRTAQSPASPAPPKAKPPQSGAHARSARRTLAATTRTAVIWGTLWALPLLVLALTGQDLLWDIAVFFGVLAVVTFGGAYAVLAYMAQQVVNHHGWLSPPQMIDALGLAETTPGPLILVTEFVALLAGFYQGGAGLALAAGIVALWSTFMPCFLWIFLAGPYLDQIAARPPLSAALQAITAAVVGVVLNLSLWFALHVLFKSVHQSEFGPISAPLPDLATFQPLAAGLMMFSALLLLQFGWGLGRVLALMAVLAGAISFI